MESIGIHIDLSEVLEAGSIITREIFPRVRDAIGGLAEYGQTQWIDAVMKAPGVWSKEKTDYAATIKWEFTGEFSARIWSDYKYADQIDEGRPARDLKIILNTSMKVRRSSTTGKLYLIIPFRHNTKDMQEGTYPIAKNLSPSMTTSIGSRVSGNGAWDIRTRAPALVEQRTYKWGDRLESENRNENGMVRMESSGTGKSRSSTYLTFRVMSEDSNGWICPAKPGLFLLQKVAEDLQPKADQLINEAANLDLNENPRGFAGWVNP